jgi:CRP-like cAMP-binding protein
VERKLFDNETIFRKGDPAHSIYFIVSGEVTLWESSNSRDSNAMDYGVDVGGGVERASLGAMSGRQRDMAPPHEPTGRRLVRYVNGGIFGELDFFLRNPRSFDAVSSSPDCVVQILTRDNLQSMQSQASQLAAALEHALLKYLSFQVNAKLGLSDGIKDAHRPE